MPDISILIPVYNGEKYIAEAIESALAQQGVDFEVLVADNASSDRTVEILKSYADPRLRILLSDRNLGIYGNMNRLVSEASAPVIKILCADDTIVPDGLRRQAEFFARHPSINVACCRAVGGNARYAKDGNRQNSSPEEGLLPEVLSEPAAVLACLAFGNPAGSLTTAMVRTKALVDAGGFDEASHGAGDFEMWARMAPNGGMLIQKAELVFVREHPEQMTYFTNAKLDMIRQSDAIYAGLYAKCDPRDRALVRWHLAVNFVSQHWNRVLKAVRSGDWSAFPAIWKKRTFTYPNFVCLVLFVLTASRRLGCRWSRWKLLERVQQRNKEAGVAQ